MDDYFAGTRGSTAPPAPGTAYPPAPATAYPPTAAPPAPVGEPPWAFAPQRPGAAGPMPLAGVPTWAPAPQRAASRLPLLLAALVAVLVVGGGLTLAWPAVNERRIAASTQVSMPSSLLGQPRVQDETTEALRSMFAPLQAELPMQFAVYGSSANPAVMVGAARGRMDGDAREAFWAGVERSYDASLPGGGLQKVDPGRLGGEMRCATVPQGPGVTACIWVDPGSMGVILLTGQPGGARTAVQVRETVERRT